MTDLIARAEAFARSRHEGQTRKGAAREPYIGHVAEVAAFTAAWGGSTTEIAAAWLHDTVEDNPQTSPEEVERLFGAEIATIVGELTDDKSLPKAERKRRQVETAPHKSASACLIKLADKTSNVAAIARRPPQDWNTDRCRAYLDWAAEVVARLPHGPAAGRAAFADALAEARASLAP